MTMKEITREELISQVKAQLALIRVTLDSLTIIQIDKSNIWLKGVRFGKHHEKLTVDRTATGRVKKGSVRFYE